MPELPEVETIRLQLEKFLSNHTIQDVEILSPKTFPSGKEKIIKVKIISLERFGKAIVINLNNHYSLIIHLKMTGQLIYRGPNLVNPPPLSKNVAGLPGKHTRIIIDLDHNGKLFFNDLRKFGWFKVVKTDELKSVPFLKNLGPEPLKDLTPTHFQEILRKSNQKIKLFLLDQKRLSGVGNIYANDALWLAKIDPNRSARFLTKNESKTLFTAIGQVLNNGLKFAGASDNSFVTATGGEGEYQNHFLVYNQKDKPCSRCQTKIKKIKFSSRGTYFCPNCQK